MTAVIEQMNGMNLNDPSSQQCVKQLDEKSTTNIHATGQQQNTNQNYHYDQNASTTQDKTQTHPLHQFDLTQMSSFYEACVNKMQEQNIKFSPTEWIETKPHHQYENQQQEKFMCLSHKQRVYQMFAKFAHESGEPMLLMPNFDYGDILNFERFLQALKQDGFNAIGKYKQYLNNKDMRKFEVDLVVVHAKFGVMLVECKECDQFDAKRRSRARIQLNNARSCFEAMGRLICEAKGWTSQEGQLIITECIALPNCQNRPVSHHQQQQMKTDQQNQSASGEQQTITPVTQTLTLRQLSRMTNYLVKSDLESSAEFGKWFSQYVVEPRNQLMQQQLEQQKQQEQEQQSEQEKDKKSVAASISIANNKWEPNCYNWMLGLINCVRNNSVMPVVYPESGEQTMTMNVTENTAATDGEENSSNGIQFQPALNVHGEFFTPAHESVRTLNKCFLESQESERIRHTICLQALWIMLNDSQKKLSVLCSEMNKQYYEEFFARQRKLYANFHNVRFYTDLASCTGNSQYSSLHSSTMKKDTEIWFFDSSLPNGSLNDVMEKCKDLQSFWVFTTQKDAWAQYKTQLDTQQVRSINLDTDKSMKQSESVNTTLPWTTGKSYKLPLRLQADLLVIGDIIGTNHLRSLYRYLKTNSVTNQANHYNSQNINNQYPQQQQNNHRQQQQLSFNPTKKFKTIKFIRGGTIENLRSSLKMHDSIQTQCILMHVGDEDLFKTRHSEPTIERVKEMATLVKEYCPRSFLCISTLMRRMSRTENANISEVNKGIMAFCKQTRDSLNCHYMLNTHFEPDYHTQEGRLLSNKGIKLYTDNFLFVVDHFMIRNNKQH